MGISQNQPQNTKKNHKKTRNKQNCGLYYAFIVNMERDCCYAKLLTMYYRKETGADSSAIQNSHTPGTRPVYSPKAEFPKQVQRPRRRTAAPLIQTQLCLKNTALVQDKQAESHKRSPGKLILRNRAIWLQPHRTKAGWQFQHLMELSERK